MSVSQIKQLNLPEVKDIDKVIRYMVYMYDVKTPLSKERDLDRRKDLARHYAGIDDDSLFKRLSGLEASVHRDILFKILKHQNSRLWSKIVTQEMFFYECVNNIIEEVNHDDDSKKTMDALAKKAKLSEEMDNIDARLERYWDEFTKADEQVKEVVKANSYSPEARILRK